MMKTRADERMLPFYIKAFTKFYVRLCAHRICRFSHDIENIVLPLRFVIVARGIKGHLKWAWARSNAVEIEL